MSFDSRLDKFLMTDTIGLELSAYNLTWNDISSIIGENDSSVPATIVFVFRSDIYILPTQEMVEFSAKVKIIHNDLAKLGKISVID